MKPAPTAPAAITAGFGRITFNGLVQAWYTGGTGDLASTFRIRRAEMKFTGEVSPQASWTVVVDAAKALSVNNSYTTVDGVKVMSGSSVNQAGRLLQDAFISLELGEGIRLTAGQFKLPLSYEGLQSSSRLEVVERALFLTDRARGAGYGDVRDVGVSLRAPLGKQVEYHLAAYNGMGEAFNATDRNDEKTLAGRVVYRVPFLPGLQLGASAATDPGTEGEQLERRRLGGEVFLARGPLGLRGEVMGGRDGEVERLGYYVHADYKLTPKLQAVLRLDTWDPDTGRDSLPAEVAERDYLAGLNYYLTGSNVKLQANLLRKTFARTMPDETRLMVNLQTAW